MFYMGSVCVIIYANNDDDDYYFVKCILVSEILKNCRCVDIHVYKYNESSCLFVCKILVSFFSFHIFFTQVNKLGFYTTY